MTAILAFAIGVIRGAVGWPKVCDSVISWSCSLILCTSRFLFVYCVENKFPLTCIKCRYYLSQDLHLTIIILHYVSLYAGPGGGERGYGPPLKNHKNIGFLSNTGPDPLKNHKATKPAFNVGPLNV